MNALIYCMIMAVRFYYRTPPNYMGNCNFSTLISITVEHDTMLNPTHFSTNLQQVRLPCLTVGGMGAASAGIGK